MYLSPCGIDCGECKLREACGGSCHESCGKPFYIKDFPVDVCPMYDCAVNKNGYKTCAECPELPCQVFYEWRDPSMTEEEHRRAVDANVLALKASLG